MAIYESTPPIVTNGLVLALDAANIRSYPGTGTTWTDLSGNNNSGSLVNGPTFSSDNGGSIVFDGSTSSAYITTPSTLILSNTISFNFWVSSIGQTSYSQAILGKDTNGANPHLLIRRNLRSDNLIWNYYNGSATFTTNFNSFFTGFNNLFINLQITADYISGVVSVYRNGVLFGTSTQTMLYPNTSAILTLGNWLPNTGLPLNGKIAISQIYNKILSANEVQQNYNALKNRFNLG
jgi:hypothetical protein